MPSGLLVPVTQIGQQQWFLLSYYGSKQIIRFIGVWKPRDVKDPSNHGVREVTLEGSVKWRPKDPAKIRIEDVPPLGPRR